MDGAKVKTPPTSPAVLTQIRESGKLLMGKSAWDIEGHWVQMCHAEFNTLGGTLFAAMSAIDIALWDIVGKKHMALPVYKLLGGRAIPARTSLRIYASEPWRGIPRPRARPTRRERRRSSRRVPRRKQISSAARRSIVRSPRRTCTTRER